MRLDDSSEYNVLLPIFVRSANKKLRNMLATVSPDETICQREDFVRHTQRFQGHHVIELSTSLATAVTFDSVSLKADRDIFWISSLCGKRDSSINC